jgi:hypothetical protein
MASTLKLVFETTFLNFFFPFTHDYPKWDGHSEDGAASCKFDDTRGGHRRDRRVTMFSSIHCDAYDACGS